MHDHCPKFKIFVFPKSVSFFSLVVGLGRRGGQFKSTITFFPENIPMSHFNQIRNFPKHSLTKKCKSFYQQELVCPPEKRLFQFVIPRKIQFLEEIPFQIINYASPLLLQCPSQQTASRWTLITDLKSLSL